MNSAGQCASFGRRQHTTTRRKNNALALGCERAHVNQVPEYLHRWLLCTRHHSSDRDTHSDLTPDGHLTSGTPYPPFSRSLTIWGKGGSFVLAHWKAKTVILDTLLLLRTGIILHAAEQGQHTPRHRVFAFARFSEAWCGWLLVGCPFIRQSSSGTNVDFNSANPCAGM